MFRFLFCINILNLYLFYFLIRHLHISHNAPYLPPKILHKFCFSFLLGITAVASEIAEHNAHTKFSGANVHVANFRRATRRKELILLARSSRGSRDHTIHDAVTKLLSTNKHGAGTVVEKWICTLLIMNFINAKWQLRLTQMEV